MDGIERREVLTTSGVQTPDKEAPFGSLRPLDESQLVDLLIARALRPMQAMLHNMAVAGMGPESNPKFVKGTIERELHQLLSEAERAGLRYDPCRIFRQVRARVGPIETEGRIS